MTIHTYAGWETYSRPDPLLRAVYGKFPRPAARDKVRLTTCAAFRARYDTLPPLVAEACDLTERYATGDKRRTRSRMLTLCIGPLTPRWTDGSCLSRAAGYLLDTSRDPIRMQHGAWCQINTATGGYYNTSNPERLDYIRCVVRNPFDAVGADDWSPSSDTRRLWSVCRDGRDYASMAILADSCEDDGCRDDGLLRHLRTHPRHCWGCWALDMIFGKFQNSH